MSNVISNISEGGKTIPIGGTNFDGEWVDVADRPLIFTTKAVGTYSVDISQYLPDDDYSYEVLLVVKLYYSGTSYTPRLFAGTDIISLITTDGRGAGVLCNNNTIINSIAPVLPLKERVIKFQITGGAAGDVYCGLIAYRRIGTNE